MVTSPDPEVSFDLSTAFDDIFEFERELDALTGLAVPKAAEAMADAFETASDRIERALSRAAKTGEINFEAMVTNILADLARIAAGAVIEQAISGAFGGGAGTAPVSINIAMPEGSDAGSIVSAQGQIAAALGQAVLSGGRWS